MITVAPDFPHFDAQTIASQGNAILGIRDSGKSYTAVALAERLYDAGIPFVAFDPIGRWRFLRVPGNGKGYPVVVAGGAAGDLPLTVESAPQIVRAAMESGVSLVIDLYDMEVSKADWKRIVAESVRVLLYGNGAHGLRHIFIEEAAEFCPQRVGPDQGRVYAEIEKLARMGGNARLGYTLINQRAEEVNKAVLELCDNLFLHRQKGRNSLNALTKWLDVADVRAGREIVSTLPTLPQGECWAWMAGTDRPVHVKVPPKNSFEPDRRAMGRQDGAAQSKTVDVATFVEALRASLSADEKAKSYKGKESSPSGMVEKSNTNDAELEIAARNATKAGYEAGFSEGNKHGHDTGYRAGFHAGYSEAIDAIREFADRLKVDHPSAAKIPNAVPKTDGNYAEPMHGTGKPTFTPSVKPSVKRATNGSGGGDLSGPQRKLLRGLAWWKAMGHDEVSRVQAATVCGWRVTSSNIRDRLSELAGRGLVEYPRPGTIRLTATGARLAPEPDHAKSLVENLRAILSGPELKVFDTLLKHRGRAVPRDDLAQEIGWSTESSNIRDRCSALSSLEIIHYPRAGLVALQQWVIAQ